MKRINAPVRILIVTLLMIAAMGLTAFAEAKELTEQEALGVALKDAGHKKSEVKRIDVELDDDKTVRTFEVEFVAKGSRTEYSYEISAEGGKILEKSVEYKYKHNKSKKKIGKKAAIKAVSKFSGIKKSTIKKGTCRYKYEHREGIYKIKFRKGSYRYEYEVLAPTGKIVEYDYEAIKKK